MARVNLYEEILAVASSSEKEKQMRQEQKREEERAKALEVIKQQKAAEQKQMRKLK